VAKRHGLTEDDWFNLLVHDRKTETTEMFVNVSVKDSPRRIDRVLEQESQLARVVSRGDAIPKASDADLSADAEGSDAEKAKAAKEELREPPFKSDGQVEELAAASGAVAGIMARTDTAARRVEGAGRARRDARGRRRAVGRADRRRERRAQPARHQLPAHLPGRRPRRLGRAHLRGADQLADEYKYVPVRRTALFIEESLYRGTKWVVFEPNDEPLWAQIRLNIGAFMHNLFRQGAFQGPRRARPTSSSATARRPPRTTSTWASSTSWSASRPSSRPSS
jgi:uncharacterized protein